MKGMKVMSSNRPVDVILVWVYTFVANAVSWFNTENVSLLKDILSIVSIFLAIAYTLYKFLKIWTGWAPWKKKK